MDEIRLLETLDTMSFLSHLAIGQTIRFAEGEEIICGTIDGLSKDRRLITATDTNGQRWLVNRNYILTD